MLGLVYGCSASGKSSYAEELAVSRYGAVGAQKGKLIYVATMYPYKWNTKDIDPETDKRIERHRRMRADKGFETVECYRDIGTLAVSNGDVLLIECMSNLLANEMYPPDQTVLQVEEESAGGETIQDIACSEKIIQGIRTLAEKTDTVIVVTNDIFSDGGNVTYDESTKQYVRNLAYINYALMQLSDYAAEIVCGIPVIMKKE